MTESKNFRLLNKLPSLDGLRAVAVVLTSLVHLVPEQVPGGFIGVDVFFVISGFLITSILLGSFARDGRIHLGEFYVRRARRLLPALIALVLVFTLVVVVISPTTRDLIVAGIVDVSVLTYTFNWGPVVGREPPWQVDHLWSLSVEEQFYILWPLLLILLLRIAGRTTIMALTASAALVSALAQTIVFDTTQSVGWVYFASPLHAHGIILGCLLAQLYVWRRAEGPLRWLAVTAWPMAASLLVILGLSLYLDVDGAVTYNGGMLLAVLAAAVLVAGLVARDTLGETAGLFSRVFSSRVLTVIGRRSYSIYLWQNFLAWALSSSLRDSWLWIPANVIATGVCAEISYRFVERRFVKPAGDSTSLAERGAIEVARNNG